MATQTHKIECACGCGKQLGTQQWDGANAPQVAIVDPGCYKEMQANPGKRFDVHNRLAKSWKAAGRDRLELHKRRDAEHAARMKAEADAAAAEAQAKTDAATAAQEQAKAPAAREHTPQPKRLSPAWQRKAQREALRAVTSASSEPAQTPAATQPAAAPPRTQGTGASSAPK